MERNIVDCLFIGHNQVDFNSYEREVRAMGVNSGAYRDLDINILRYNNRTYSAADIFNLFCSHLNVSIKSLKQVETFNAAIAYLGTYLHRKGFRFDYINSFQDEKELLGDMLKQENILTVAIITTLYVTPSPILEIIEFVRRYNKTAKIIIGGPFISTKNRILNAVEFSSLLKLLGADFYVNSSQGEAALVKIIDSLKKNWDFNSINNIYYRQDKEYVSTVLSRESNNLSGNMVDWDLFAGKVGEFVNLRTSISCPFSCAFCGYPEHAGTYRTADVGAVERELNKLEKIGSVKSVMFIDDTFNIPGKRFKEILRLMIKNKYTFKWNSYFRCQYADREMMELMKESGCESVFLGLESGSNRILKNMNKKATVEEYLKGIALLNEYEIPTFGNFIVGFPGETHATVQDTVRFIKECGIDFYRAQLWYCEPITPIWNSREKYDLKGENFEWSHGTMNSKEACDLIDELILSIEDPVRFPQYYFDFDSVIHLTYKGLTLQQVKEYLRSYNNGIKQKLPDSNREEVDGEIIEQIHRAILGADDYSSHVSDRTEGVDESEAEFNF